jgi:hypothetical protein
MNAPQLVKPSAGQLDVWCRVAGLGVPIGLVIGLVPPMIMGAGAAVSAVMLVVVVVVPAFFSTVFGFRAISAAKKEKAAGYSTMFDIDGYELRDPRTLEVVRPAGVRPSGTVRRSLFRSMLTVKPGTLLAKRIAEDEAADRENRP